MHLRVERPKASRSNEQRRKSFFTPASLPRLHLPSGGLLVAGAEITPGQDSCCPGPNQTCRQTSPSQRVVVRYSVHPRTGRRSGMAGQIERRPFVSLGRGQSQKEEQKETSRPGHPWLNCMVDCTPSITLPDNIEFRGHVVTFPWEKPLKQTVCWGIQGEFRMILFSGASFSPLKNEHSMREWTRVHSIEQERML
jgi:hypothetical protein